MKQEVAFICDMFTCQFMLSFGDMRLEICFVITSD